MLAIDAVFGVSGVSSEESAGGLDGEPIGDVAGPLLAAEKVKKDK